nr:complexin-3-like [Gasterosteus aculeatus aculeatus]
MESVLRVRNWLRTPIGRLTSWGSKVKERKLCAKRRKKRGRFWRGRGRCHRFGRTPPPRTAQPKDLSIICSYEKDLEKERKLREATNAQKNAERAAMRAHFRRKYQLSESTRDTNHLKSVGGKVSLPRELSKIIHSNSKSKDNGFNLLSAFQGLGFGTEELKGGKRSRTSTPAPAACRVQ